MGDVVDRRVQRNCELLAGWCHPRILATFFRTIWNGWTTDRRMRSLLGSRRTCILGCAAEDSLEHYCCCPTFWGFATKARPRGLGLRPDLRGKATFFLTREGLFYKDVIRFAVGIYALFRVVCSCRHEGQHKRFYNFDTLLYLWAKRGADNSKASRLLRYNS